MIEELVEANAPDKVIGKLELKRQKLIEKANDPYATIPKGLSLPLPQEDPYEGQLNERKQLVIPDVDKSELNKDKYVERYEEVQKLNKTIDIYDDMILKIAIHNPNDASLEELKSKRNAAAAKVNLLLAVNDQEPSANAKQIIADINTLDQINEKLYQCRIAIRRSTKKLFKIITSPDYTPGYIPSEMKELYLIKQHKAKVEEQEQVLLKEISKFFKTKLTI